MKEIDEIYKSNPLDERYYEARKSQEKYNPNPSSSWAKGIYGKKYNKGMLERLRKDSIEGFSINRSAGLSLTVLALLSEKDEKTGAYKYTYEQIMDPDQLLDRKQEVFDEIITATTTPGEENRNKLKKLYYDGMKRGSEVLDQMVSELDLKDEHLELSETFHKLGGLSGLMYDAWQEIDEDSFNVTSYVQKDNPEVINFGDAKEVLKNKYVGPYSIWNSKCKVLVEQHINAIEGNEVKHGGYVSSAFDIHVMKQYLNDWSKNGKGMSPSEYFGKNTTHNVVGTISSNFLTREPADWTLDLMGEPELQQKLDQLLSTGEMFKNSSVKVIPGKGIDGLKYINMPKIDPDNKTFKIRSLRPAKEKAHEPDKNKKTSKAKSTGKIITENKTAESKTAEKKSTEKKITEKKSTEKKLNDKVAPKKGGKLPVDFDSYIFLHTKEGGLKADTPEEKNAAISKVLAAYTLKNLKRSFSIKEIHKVAEHISKTYGINDKLQIPKIDEVLKNKNAVLEFGENRRRSLYDIKPDKYDAFINEMQQLSNNMISSKWHSDNYKALFNAVKEAANLNQKTAGMSDAEKAEEFRNISIKVIHAVDAYTVKKEKVRSTTKGEDCFNNAMDALAIVSKNTAKQKGDKVHPRAQEIISRIQNVRGESRTIKKMNFENVFGGKRAETRMTEIKSLNGKKAVPAKK